MTPREAIKIKLIALIEEIEPFVFLKAKQYKSRLRYIELNSSGDSKYYTTSDRKKMLVTAGYELEKPRKKPLRPMDGSLTSIMEYSNAPINLNEFCDKAIERTMAEPFLSQINWSRYEGNALDYSLVE